eukprot:11433355-Heterocapsa_arctica.AAC.1
MAYIAAQEATEEADAYQAGCLGTALAANKNMGSSNSGGQQSPSQGGRLQASEPGNCQNGASNHPGTGPHGGFSSG